MNTKYVSYSILAVFIAIPPLWYVLEPKLLFIFLGTNNEAVRAFLLWNMIAFLVGGIFLFVSGPKKGLMFWGLALLFLGGFIMLDIGTAILFQYPLLFVILCVFAVSLGGAISIPFDYLENFKDVDMKSRN